MHLTPGTLIGNYEIKHRLGAGGMGEVYYARDTRLGRHVAMKILLPELTANADRLRRFKQEARTTSALNHPNIVTIFEVGETDSLHYLVTEFIDGLTLRHYLIENAVSVREMLDIVIQVASALAAAQASGIVHRDIKPENIMRRADGIVKVLDFGLAKLMPGPERTSSDDDLPTAVNIKTDPGSVVGTVTYMSPEQLRGTHVDGRSDIWSLGVVLYELIAGRAPFTGASKSDIIAAILREEPPLLTKYSSDAPGDLQEVVSQMLRKDPALRYQSAKAVLDDLQRLKQDLDLGVRLGHVELPPDRTAAAAATDSVASEAMTERVQTSKIPPARPTSGVEYLLSEIKRHRTGAMAIGIAIAVIVLSGVMWFAVKRPQRAPSPASNSTLQVSEIKTTSNVREAAISPDGRFIATVAEDAGRQSIRIQQPSNAGESQVLATGDQSYRGLVFSRDGYSIYYLARKDQEPLSLYQVPVLGGAVPRKLIDNINTPVGLSPDGNQMAFVRKDETATHLLIGNADGSNLRELAQAAGQTAFGTFNNNNAPAWSPDSQIIAVPMASNIEPMQMTVSAVKVADGSMSMIGARRWYVIGQLAWLNDGSGLIMDAQEKMAPTSTSQVWLMSYPSGEAHTVTNDLNYYRGVSLTADSRMLITTRSVRTSNVWKVSAAQPTQISQLPSSMNKGWGGVFWTADGKILYSSSESGTAEIWSMDANGDDVRQLTFDKHTNVEPAMPRVGTDLLFFASYASGLPHIWRMDSAGHNQRQITNGQYEDWPDCSPDGQWIVYQNDEAGKERIWKMPAEGGQPLMLVDKPARHPIVSPDGRLIACYLLEGGTWRLALVPFAGGDPVQTFEIPAGVAEQWHGPRWTADNQAVSYIVTRGGLSNLWLQPVAGGSARQLTSFSENQIYSFAWSPDGKELVCVRGSDTRSVILLKDFRVN